MGAKKAKCFYVQLIPWISSHKYVFDTVAENLGTLIFDLEANKYEL